MRISPTLGTPVRRLVESLARSYATGNLVLVAGAGVSRAAGLPGWREMVETLQERALSSITPPRTPADLENVLSSLHGGDPIARADSLQRLMQVGAFRKELQRSLYPALPEPYLPASVHWHIASLADRSLMPDTFTSNYDELLEEAKRSLGRAGRIRHFHGRLAQDWTGTTRLADPPVITSRDYLAADGRKRYERLQAAMRDKTVLLVGFSLSDPNLARVIRDAARDCRALVVASPGALTPNQQALRLDLLLRYWRGLNVEVTAIEAYEELPAFLLSLRREVLRLRGESLDAEGSRALKASIRAPFTTWRGVREWRDALRNAVTAAKYVAPGVERDPSLRAGFFAIDAEGYLNHSVSSSSTRSSMTLPQRRLYAGDDGPWGAAGYAFSAGVPVSSAASGPAFDRNVPGPSLLAWQAERSSQNRLPAASVLCVPAWARYNRRLVPIGVTYFSSSRATAFDDRTDAEELRWILSQTLDSMIEANRTVPGGLA